MTRLRHALGHAAGFALACVCIVARPFVATAVTLYLLARMLVEMWIDVYRDLEVMR